MSTRGRILAWLIPVSFVACSALVYDTVSKPKEQPPRLTVNHTLHLEHDLECLDCHDSEETGTPLMPKAESCFECHETLEEESDAVRKYFADVRQADGSYQFAELSYTGDLVAAHKKHAEQEVSCADCHGEPTDKAFTRPPLFQFKGRCLDCHEQKNGPMECAACHRELRKDKKPPSHDAKFLGGHGGTVPPGWQTGGQSSCTFCHSVPDSCTECHSRTKPSDHAELTFLITHGKGDHDTFDGPFDQNSCSLCHEELDCVRCHQTTKPQSHTVSFERRLHGLWADVDRARCMTCHKQDVCVRCHQTTKPVNHVGSWGTGSQTHCLGCHEPLQSTGCYACHKSTLGHLQAPNRPVNPTHVTAVDPAACETCHPVTSHFNDGGLCRRCHR